jgi:lipopolysaccharide transport system permease protein
MPDSPSGLSSGAPPGPALPRPQPSPGGARGIRADFSVILREQVEFRDLLLAITRRDLLLRYENSVIGFGWAVLVPLLSMLVFWVIFTRVAPLDTDVPYALYAYAGLLPWTWFAASVRFSALSLATNPHLVTKVYFPREILPFSAVLVSLVDLCVASSVLAMLMWYYGLGVTWALLTLPLLLLVQLVFTAAVSLAVAMANLFYRDVQHLLEVLLTVWMFATSVVYPVDRVGGRLEIALRLNPMTPIIDAYRQVVLRGELPEFVPLALTGGFSLVLLAGVWLLFHRAEHRFAEEA